MLFSLLPARPDAPSGVNPEEVDDKSVTLSWSKPKSDGGKKIQGYIVEYKEPTSNRWKTANDFPCTDTKYVVGGLDKGKDYEFRVRAKNIAGLSEPSKATAPITCKPKYSKFVF